MKLSQFKFKLPEDKIALHPAKYRDAITPSHIARVIVTIMPNRFGLLLVTIVIFEEGNSSSVRLVVAISGLPLR